MQAHVANSSSSGAGSYQHHHPHPHQQHQHQNPTNQITSIKGHQSANSDRKISPKKKKRKYSVDGSGGSSGGQNSLNSNLNSTMGPGAQTLNNVGINIIDRVLDLNKYDQDVGLYTLCRDWMNASTCINDSNRNTTNPPSSSSSAAANKNTIDTSSSNSDGGGGGGHQEFITKLPDPCPTTDDTSLCRINETIKTTIRYTEQSDMDLIRSLNVNSDELLQTHALLKLHVNRWKSARREWLRYYKTVNKSYENSYQVLKSIFEDIN